MIQRTAGDKVGRAQGTDDHSADGLLIRHGSIQPIGKACVDGIGICHARIAIGEEGTDTGTGRNSRRAVGAALGADLVPEIAAEDMGVNDLMAGREPKAHIPKIKGLDAVVDLSGHRERIGVALHRLKGTGVRLLADTVGDGGCGESRFPSRIRGLGACEVDQRLDRAYQCLPDTRHTGNQLVSVLIEVIGQGREAAVGGLARGQLLVHTGNAHGTGGKAQSRTVSA